MLMRLLRNEKKIVNLHMLFPRRPYDQCLSESICLYSACFDVSCGLTNNIE